jgi:hypothetical protein
VYHACVIVLGDVHVRGTKVRRLVQYDSILFKGDSQAVDHGAHERKESWVAGNCYALLCLLSSIGLE